MSGSKDNSKMNGAKGAAAAGKIDWGYMLMAVMAIFGLVQAGFTAWQAWAHPMDFVRESYLYTYGVLLAVLVSAIELTFARSAAAKVVIAFAIVVAIFLQLNLLAETETSHRQSRPTPAAVAAPAAKSTIPETKSAVPAAKSGAGAAAPAVTDKTKP